MCYASASKENAAAKGVLNMDTVLFVGTRTISIVGIFRKTDAKLATFTTRVVYGYLEVVWIMTSESMNTGPERLSWTKVFAAVSFFGSGSNQRSSSPRKNHAPPTTLSLCPTPHAPPPSSNYHAHSAPNPSPPQDHL